MIELLTTHLVLAARVLGGAVRHRARHSPRARPDDDAGLSTLELTILALGLLTLAGILLVALTNAINRRAAQIQ